MNEQLLKRLNLSGVIVLKSVCWSSMKSAAFIAVAAMTLQVGEAVAQLPRMAYSLRKNVPQQPQQPQQPQVYADPALVVTQSADPFRELLDRAIEVTSKRQLTANSHSPWKIFHCILALRQECMLRLGKEKVNAIEWLSSTEPQFDNQPWLLLTPHGAKFHPYTKKYYFEGHPAQFLALMSQSNLPIDHPFHVQGKVVTLNDLVINTMKEVNSKEEVTWVLWALQHFLKPDAVWLNQMNETWSIEKLVQIETEHPVVGAPCGGNHRLFALTRARDQYLKHGGELRGVWLQADQKINQHIEIARSLQNPDGSFSSEWYKGPMHTNDVNSRFNTSGHTMEFLAISLPQQRLEEPWVRNAVWMLSRELIIHRDTQIDCGPLFHTLDALILYRDRIRPKAPAIQPVTPETEKPVQPPQITNRPLDLPASADLKPNSEAKPTPLATETTPETKSTETTPTEPSQAESGAKTSTESEYVLPRKKVDPKEAIVNPPDAQSNSALPVLNKSPKALSTTVVPKINPALLANIGQAAPSTKPSESRSESRLSSGRAPGFSSAPALLPDFSATPLKESMVPINQIQGATNVPKNEPSSASSTQDSPSPSPAENDDPASAIKPANE